jgi:hypothetical protein
MPTRLAPAICFALAVLFSVQLSAQTVSPPRGTELRSTPITATTKFAPQNTVQVVVLKSWGQTSIWDAMSTNWQNFGTTPVSVDDSTYVHTDFTYQDLVNSGANVLVISDPAGGGQQYSQAEMDAVGKYAQGGHTVIGTYAVFQWGTTDNRGLAPIFGLNSTLEFDTSQVGISNLFQETRQNECLFTGIPGTSWQSQGYPYTQVPTSGSWIGHRGKAMGLAESDKWVGAVGIFSAATFTSVYISNFPEYNGGTDDEQLLYNAVTCYASQ